MNRNCSGCTSFALLIEMHGGSDLLLIMDKLKALVNKNKPVAPVLSHKERIAQQEQESRRRRAEEEAEATKKTQRRLDTLQDFLSYDSIRKKVKTQEEAPVSVDEVKKRLRALKQPVTLFAQKQMERWQRLVRLQKFKEDHPDVDMADYDQHYQQQLQKQEIFNQLDAQLRNSMIEPRLGDDPEYLSNKRAMIEKQGDSVPYAKVCDELYLWMAKVLRDWSRALEQKYGGENERGQQGWERWHRVSGELSSLQLVLRQRGGREDMIRGMYQIMNWCLLREYIPANDKYLELSVSKAPWPMGIAMLSLTVRKNGPKVSHVLDEQMPRRWMQALKRMVSLCQELYPPPDSENVVDYSINSML